MKTLKYSRQRESIKASLMNRHDHPTADALYAMKVKLSSQKRIKKYDTSR